MYHSSLSRYAAEMKPVMAQWMMLWLEANHVSGLRADMVEAYLTRDAASLADEPWEPHVQAAAAAAEEAAGMLYTLHFIRPGCGGGG